ncbi:hypothetical protein D3C80_1397660 [compost metagenome]
MLSGVAGHGEDGHGVVERRLGGHLDRFRLDEGLDVVVHDRLPVAEEDVDLLLLDTGEDDLLRRLGLAGRIAQTFEQLGGDRGGGDHVGPADHADADLLATGVFGGQQGGTAQGE